MKLEARHQTSDILSQIDNALFAVSNLSAKIAFENLFPTCEIGEEIGRLYQGSGSWDSTGREYWDEMGRQRNECYDISCDCLELSLIQEVPGLNQPYFLTHSENVGLWNEEVELSENDQDALDYTLEFFGASHARFEIDYGGIEPKLIHEIMEPEPE